MTMRIWLFIPTYCTLCEDDFLCSFNHLKCVTPSGDNGCQMLADGMIFYLSLPGFSKITWTIVSLAYLLLYHSTFWTFETMRPLFWLFLRILEPKDYPDKLANPFVTQHFQFNNLIWHLFEVLRDFLWWLVPTFCLTDVIIKVVRCV